MAITKITPVKLADVNTISGGITFTAATSATDGFEIPFGGDDFKTLILVQNTEASDAKGITVKMGNGIQGVADLALDEIAAGSMAGFTLDSGAFKQVSGEHKGNVIVIPEAATVKIAVVELP